MGLCLLHIVLHKEQNNFVHFIYRTNVNKSFILEFFMCAGNFLSAYILKVCLGMHFFYKWSSVQHKSCNVCNIGLHTRECCHDFAPISRRQQEQQQHKGINLKMIFLTCNAVECNTNCTVDVQEAIFRIAPIFPIFFSGFENLKPSIKLLFSGKKPA